MRFNMKTIPVQEAEGTILCQDITRIVPGGAKGPVFRKGHVVEAEDIPVLLDVGKEHLYVYEPGPGMVHEEDAAWRIVRRVAGANLSFSGPKEGRIDLVAECDGLLEVDEEGLFAFNMVGDMTLSTLPGNLPVRAGQTLAATRVTPLVVHESLLEKMEATVRGPLLRVVPFTPKRAALATTGSEIFKGRIKDGFGPVLARRLAVYGCEVTRQELVGDDPEVIAASVERAVADGFDMVCVTGGMSVDPDDRTPGAIARTGARVVCYGAPVYPGAMFMLAYLSGPRGDVPVLGLPGGVLHGEAGILEMVAPRLLAGQVLEAPDIARLGYGGFLTPFKSMPYARG